MNDKQIVFLGYFLLTGFIHILLDLLSLCSFGNQGAAQAQNLRDSGIPNEKILIANREDVYAEDAKSKGFIVEHAFETAASVADSEENKSETLFIPDLYVTVLFICIPDQVQPRVFNERFAPHLKATATIVVASGYNVFYKLLKFTSNQDVVMVAPRYEVPSQS